MDQDSPILPIAEVIKLPEKKESKFNYEYQELCSSLEPIYGRLVWTLPHKRGFDEGKIRRAHEICQKRGNLTFPYLVGVLKRL